MSTTAPSVTVRRASTQDAGALLSIASRFVARSPYWGLVAPDDEMVRATILQGLGGAAGTAHRGVVFVIEEGEGEQKQIVGAIVGAMVSLPWSRALVAEEVGGWVDEKHVDSDRHEELRASLRHWARSARAPIIRMGRESESKGQCPTCGRDPHGKPAEKL